jgi:hypothetical protein
MAAKAASRSSADSSLPMYGRTIAAMAVIIWDGILLRDIIVRLKDADFAFFKDDSRKMIL